MTTGVKNGRLQIIIVQKNSCSGLFFKTTVKNREIRNNEVLVNEEDKVNQTLQNLAKDLSHIMQILVKEYTADSNGANKHKTNSYKLVKKNHVKNVQVKPDIKGTQVLFIARSVTLLHQDETSSIQLTCICHN